MADINALERKIEQIIDELKGLCQTNGLSNQASEEVVITSVFLYKFLNDKFMSNLKEFAAEIDMDYKDVLKNENSEMDAFYDSYPQDVAFTYDETIDYLINKVSYNEFYKIFDDALEKISNDPKNEAFSVETADGARKPLFTRITENVESSKRNNFAKNIFGIISQERFDFGDAFKNNFDFYSRIFEYLIKDYNVASGVYAEYFTPQAISSIIAKILVQMSPVEDKLYDVYDPSAGSGSLVLHLANELGHGSFGEKAQVYTQDISGKSSRFLRINMMLNGLTSSLDNIIEGDTLDTPAHYNTPHEPSSGVKQFDFITSNPPFKTDFSSTRDAIEQKWSESDERDGLKRFFAGIPNVPPKDKEKMPIYLLFIQHILWSLKDNGKAAIVVPTVFNTASKRSSKIAYDIRKTLIDNKWLRGAISMPSNIFANTGTNVTVLFVDKANTEDEIILMDASKLGESIKEGKNQKTVLSDTEIIKIENTFINKKVVEDFSVIIPYKQVENKNYSLSAGQYFDVKIEIPELSLEEYNHQMDSYLQNLKHLFAEGKQLEVELEERMGELRYGKN